MIDDVIEYGSKLDAWTNATLLRRDVVPPGTGNWAEFYKGIAASADTLTVMNDESYLGTFTAAVESTFSTNKVNVLVGDLYGCTSLIAVSTRATTSILPTNLPSRTARAIPSGPVALTRALTRGRMHSQVTLLWDARV